MPTGSPVSSLHGKADQVGVVELVLVAIVGQRRAVDEKLGAGQRLGGIAVVDALEAHHHDLVGRPDVGDLEGAAVLGVERPVVAGASGSPVKVLTRSSPLMPWAAPITAIWTGFLSLGIAILFFAGLLTLADHSITALHRF